MCPAAPLSGVNPAREFAVELPLKGQGLRRVADALLGLAAALTQYLLAGFFVTLALRPSIYEAHPAAGGRLLAGALAVATFAFGRWGRQRIKRAATLNECLVVMPHGVIVRHGSLLTAPLMIARENVRLVLIDDGNRSADNIRPRASWPMLDPLPRSPNLLLLFHEPVNVPAPRRRLDSPRRAPGSHELGLLVRVKEPAKAQRAFDGWGVVNAPTSEDAVSTATG